MDLRNVTVLVTWDIIWKKQENLDWPEPDAEAYLVASNEGRKA